MTALIPARAGSKRIQRKNMRPLAGKPLLYWTIRAAIDSGVFERLIVSSEDQAVRDYAIQHGACIAWRSEEFAGDTSPDIEWVRELFANGPWPTPEQFAILRPTSPFRTAATIRRAYDLFQRTPDVHSLRAVEPVKQHPGKMWWCNGPGYPLTPVCDAKRSDGTPWHSSPTQTLPPCYVQNASLEMAWTYVVKNLGTISGTKILPFFTEGYEGLNLDTPEDWAEAERLLAHGLVSLPSLALASETSATASR